MTPYSSELDTTIDHHIHTRLCHHAAGEMEAYVEAAIEKGLKKIFFLEHMEEGIDYFEVTWLTENDFDYYFKEGQRLKKAYAKDIEIGLGTEVGYNPSHRKELLARIQNRDWDIIGVSYHYYKPSGHEQHLNLVSRKGKNLEALSYFDQGELLHIYFDTLMEAVDYLPGDFLCHLDAGLRYLPGLQYNDSHQEKIHQLLVILKQKKMALEINTSGIVIRNEPFPVHSIVQAAQELRIPLLLGSDAHAPANVGRFFDRFAPSPMD